MIKDTQTISSATANDLSMFDHFVELVLKGLGLRQFRSPTSSKKQKKQNKQRTSSSDSIERNEMCM